MATFREVEKFADSLSFKARDLDNAKELVRHIEKTNSLGVYIRVLTDYDNGHEMVLNNVPKEELIRFLEQYRIQPMVAEIEEGKKELEALTKEITY